MDLKKVVENEPNFEFVVKIWAFSLFSVLGLGASKIKFSEADLIQSFTIDIANNT